LKGKQRLVRKLPIKPGPAEVQRAFEVPDSVDAQKIEATFKNGVLTVTLPKSPEAQKKEKSIPVKKG
jgi:HSP20 family molecular chaperone IbpA